MESKLKTIYKATWEKLQGRWTKAVLACVAFTFVVFIIVFLIISACIGGKEGAGVQEMQKTIGVDDMRLYDMVQDDIIFSYIISAILILPFIYGLARFFLNYYDEEKATFGSIFSPMFSVRIWSAMILRYGIIALYSLLLVVPGMIKAYSYALTDYLLAEDRSMSGIEAMKESERLMKGHRWELFKLDLLLVPCFILSHFTFGILNLWIVPFVHTMHICFYRNVLMGMDEEEIGA